MSIFHYYVFDKGILPTLFCLFLYLKFILLRDKYPANLSLVNVSIKLIGGKRTKWLVAIFLHYH